MNTLEESRKGFKIKVSVWPVFRIKVSMWPVAAEEQSCPRGVAFCPQSVSGEEGRGGPGRAQGAGDWGGRGVQRRHLEDSV